MVDERAAAFVGLGLAQQTGMPTALICTSGTAALNYAPAVAEAYYQQIPLLVLTADRPPEWIGQNDNQTIEQHHIYGPHCRAAYDLPVDCTHPDARWHVERIVSEAINRTLWPVAGPVHVNVPLREPLYPSAPLVYDKKRSIITQTRVEPGLPEAAWKELMPAWQSAKRRLVVVGLHSPDSELSRSLKQLRKQGAVVLADIASNFQAAQSAPHFDIILASAYTEFLRRLQPDLLVSFGGPLVSKNLKRFLRESKPAEHWGLQLNPEVVDTFQSLTRTVPVRPGYFFTEMVRRGKGSVARSDQTYISEWQTGQAKAEQLVRAFLQETGFAELSAMSTVLANLPPDSHLQLGNSAIIRLAQLISLAERPDIRVNANRGTSGIDGTVSTAVGAALATDKVTTLLVGDLAFFYDRNGLWQKGLPSNLRIIVFNNGGGGIFRFLDGSRAQPELDDYFEVAQTRTAKLTAKDHGLSYFVCGSTTELEKILPDFFAGEKSPAILEIEFDKHANANALLKFQSIMREKR